MLKSIFPILYISIFWILSNGYYIFWIFFINKKFKYDEYIFSSLIFNYGIFFGISKGIIYSFEHTVKYIKKRINDNNEELLKKKKFYLNNFIILIIQYIFIISFYIMGFEYKFNEIIIETDISLLAKYISIIIFIVAINIIMAYLSDYKTSKFFIIFIIFYPISLVYFSFLFSSFLDSKYIIIGLSLIGIEILSLLFNIFLKNFELLHFFVYSSFLSLIGLIIALIFIHSCLQMLYISLFYLASNGLYIFWNYAIFKLCKLKLNEFLFLVLIFNYNIFLAFAFLIKYCFKFIIKIIKERIDDNSNNLQAQKYFYLKNFIILLIQFVFILVSIILGFQYKFNEILIKSDASLEAKYIPFSIVIFLSAITIACLYQKKTLKFLIIFNAIFPFFIIYYSFLFSSFIEPKYIIIGLSLISKFFLSYSISF